MGTESRNYDLGSFTEADREFLSTASKPLKRPLVDRIRQSFVSILDNRLTPWLLTGVTVSTILLSIGGAIDSQQLLVTGVGAVLTSMTISIRQMRNYNHTYKINGEWKDV